MARPKVALVNVFFPPQSIGGATRVLADNIDVMLARHGGEFDLVGYASDAGAQIPGTLECYGHQGFRVYRAGARRRPNMDWHPSDDEQGRLFEAFLAFERPDLVHFHCIQRLGGRVVEAARKRGIPYVVTVHDAWWISDFQFLVDPQGHVHAEGHASDEVPRHLPDGVTAGASLERRRYLKDLLAGARRVLVVSEAFAELYRKNGVAGAIANRNGVARRQWQPRKPADDGRLRLAHVGGMSRHKGYHLFREALSGGGYRNLEALVVDLSRPFGYESRGHWNGLPVTHVGRYPQERITELFARIDVLVAPSLWPESFGLVTREAALAGAWVVASDRGGIGEDVRDGLDGNIVDVGDATAMAALFRAMDADPARYRSPRPGADIREPAEQVDELVGHYRAILRDTRGQGGDA